MSIDAKTTILNRLYALYDEVIAPFETACRQGCSACCTCNVTCTTLEGWLMVDHLMACGALDTILEATSSAPSDRFQPALTINHLVALCVRGEAIPEESNDPGAGRCVWLEDQACRLYAVRPFACRSMCSTDICRSGGQANMPPFILSLNHVMMQYLEALDCPGASGNLVDILRFLADDHHRAAYLNSACRDVGPPLAENQSFSVLMIPPEHRDSIQPFLMKAKAILQGVESCDP